MCSCSSLEAAQVPTSTTKISVSQEVVNCSDCRMVVRYSECALVLGFSIVKGSAWLLAKRQQ